MIFRKKIRTKSFVSAVIVAAGSGSRMGTDIPKQFIEVLGKPVLAYTLEKFQNCSGIDEIVVVTREDSITMCNDIAKNYGITKLSVITRGGDSRQDSVRNGLRQLSENSEYVLIHDGARPLISVPVIEKCISLVQQSGACAVGVRMKDTIKYSDDGNYITKTVDRSRLWNIQTPQAFESALICDLHDRAEGDGFSATDDCMLAEHYGVKTAIVEGDYENIKITSPQDIYVMEGLIGL